MVAAYERIHVPRQWTIDLFVSSVDSVLAVRTLRELVSIFAALRKTKSAALALLLLFATF